MYQEKKDIFTCLNNLVKGNISTAKGQAHPIAGKGTIKFQLSDGSIKKVSNVLYVLGIQKNLLSVGSLTGSGYIACFDKSRCLLFTKNSKTSIAEGIKNQKNGLYQLIVKEGNYKANMISSTARQ